MGALSPPERAMGAFCPCPLPAAISLLQPFPREGAPGLCIPPREQPGMRGCCWGHPPPTQPGLGASRRGVCVCGGGDGQQGEELFK